ncbi:MAG: T9SS type A sorting domain-containing protein [Cytophagales bacterium]
MKKYILLFYFIYTLVNSQNFKICGGHDFSAVVCNNKNIYTWGSNLYGQMGCNLQGQPYTDSFYNLPKVVGTLPSINKITLGHSNHILAIDTFGYVWSWGLNDYGQLGRGTIGGYSSQPKKILRGSQSKIVDKLNDPSGIYLHNILSITSGVNYSFAIEKGTGKVLAWGKNNAGQLGDSSGSNINKSTPVYVKTNQNTYLTDIIQIEAGEVSTYALDINGNVWSWGSQWLGRQNTGLASRVISNPNHLDNMISYSGTNYLSNITQISAGVNHCLAIDKDGKVWSWGGDWAPGQLGQGNGYQSFNNAGLVVDVGISSTTGPWLGTGIDGKAIQLAASQASSAILMENGKVVTFGANGLYTSYEVKLPSGSYLCGSNGGVSQSGTLGTGICNPTTNCVNPNLSGNGYEYPNYVNINSDATTHLSNITEISEGDAWFYAINNSGQIYTWGYNKRGELGLGDYTDKCYPTILDLPSSCKLDLSVVTNNKDMEENNEILITPNPNRGNFVITGLNNKKFDVIISSSLGQFVYKTQLFSELCEINLKELASGIYFLTLKNDKEILIKRIIVE